MNRPLRILAVLCTLAAVAAAQEVTLPLSQYEDLRSRAQPAAAPTPDPPAPFALEVAQIEIVAARQSARVTQRVTLSIFASGWQTIPLPSAGSVAAVQLGSLEGRIAAEKGLQLIVRGRGRHVVRLDSVVPLGEDETAARLTRTLTLALPGAAAVTGAVTTSDEDVQEIDIAAGGLARGAAAARRAEFVGEPGGLLQVRLLGKGRVLDRARLPLKFRARAATLADVARTRTRLTAWLRWDVLGGQLQALDVDLPKGFDVTSVAPAEVGWDVVEGRLSVTPGAAVEKSLALTVELTGEPTPSFAAPLLVPRGAAQTTLMAAVKVSADGYAEVTESGTVRRAEDDDLVDLPSAVRQAGTPFFVVRDRAQPPHWSVTWSEGAQVLAAQVDRLLVNFVAGEAGRAAYEFWAVVRSSGTTEIAFRPPEGLELVGVERDGVAIQPGVSEKGLVLPLAAGEATQVIHVSGLLGAVSLPVEGEYALAVPASSAPIARVEVMASLPPGRVYSLVHEDRRSGLPDVPSWGSQSTAPAGQGLSNLAVKRAGSSDRAPVSFTDLGRAASLAAGWSALTETPGPLVIRIKPSREKEGWF